MEEALGQLFDRSTRCMCPVLTPNIAAFWPSTHVQYDTEYDVPYHRGDLDDREHELSFAIAANSEQIDRDDQDQENGDKRIAVDVAMSPVLYRQRRGDDLKREYHKPLHGIAGQR